jgi:hypothetical protein
LAALPTYPLDRLSRYEYVLWRHARQLTYTLESLRARKGEPIEFSIPFPRPREKKLNRTDHIHGAYKPDRKIKLACLFTYQINCIPNCACHKAIDHRR